MTVPKRQTRIRFQFNFKFKNSCFNFVHIFFSCVNSKCTFFLVTETQKMYTFLYDRQGSRISCIYFGKFAVCYTKKQRKPNVLTNHCFALFRHQLCSVPSSLQMAGTQLNYLT